MNRSPRLLSSSSKAFFGSVLALLLAGCSAKAIRPDQDPADLLAQACKPGLDVVSARGSVWLKAKSKEASGQFPANVKASPENLDLEVTNLIGGTEAFIQVRGKKYEIRVPGKSKKEKARVEKGANSWGGIPLRWADALFLGRIPCPNAAQLKDAKLLIEENGQLTIETPATLDFEAERFVYRFRKWAGAPWAESLHWERKGTNPLAVKFGFDQPDDKTGSPLKWEAESAQGEVKIRWKDHAFETRAK
jgi:hypothetical protein